MSDALNKIPGMDQLIGLTEMGADALLTLLSSAIDAVGQGTEWTGEQIDRLGELEGQLADKIRSMKGE